MGCFSFGAKRKVPEQRTPENSSTLVKPRAGTPGGSSGRAGGGTTAGSHGMPLYSPGSGQAGPHSPPSSERDQKFGGQPQPLPAPLLAAQSPGKPIRTNSDRSQPSKSDEKGAHTLDRAMSNTSRLPNSEVGMSGLLREGGGGGPGWGGGWYNGAGGSASGAGGGNSGGNSTKGERMSKTFSSVTRKHGGLIAFSSKDLEAMTKGFTEDGFLGEGGFGAVFKGCLADPETGRKVPIAVKVLNINGNQGETEWLTEVTFLGHLHHPNLVRLIGYCADGEQRMLVYEYMPHGSLEFALFQSVPGEPPLSWNRRMKIALGAARGLAYLHEEADHQVIYRDFKTSNILLDKDYETKLSDFGLARSGPEGDESHVTTRVVGTMGYAAPEYVMTGHLTTKSDVWGFGVVLLELLTGRVAMDKHRPKEEHNLVDWAEPYLANPSKLYKIMDPELGGRYSVKGAQMAAALIQSCLNKKPKSRPKMSEVVQALLPIQDLHDMAGFTVNELKSSLRKTRIVSGSKASTSGASAAPAEQGNSASRKA